MIESKLDSLDERATASSPSRGTDASSSSSSSFVSGFVQCTRDVLTRPKSPMISTVQYSRIFSLSKLNRPLYDKSPFVRSRRERARGGGTAWTRDRHVRAACTRQDDRLTRARERENEERWTVKARD